jgi:subtilisin family serine protease
LTQQFDPALKELLLRRTGDSLGRLAPEDVAEEMVPVVARLVDPSVRVESLEVVASFGNIVTGRVPMGRVVDVHEHQNVVSLKASRGHGPTLDVAAPLVELADERRVRSTFPDGVTGRGVVIGFAGWGFDYSHVNAIRDDGSGGTRYTFLWDQRGARCPESPEPFGYGIEFTREQMDESLRNADPFGALGYDPADTDRGAGCHETGVVDVAAGNGHAPGSMRGLAPGADLIGVHLRGEDTGPLETIGDSVRVLEAVRYIVDRAQGPVVVNLSLDRTGGPHDQSPLGVQALDALAEERRACIVTKSGGNYYTANLHCSGRLRTGEQVDLPWQVAASNDEVAELEIWYSGSDQFSVSLIDPVGREVATAELGQDRVVQTSRGLCASLWHRRKDSANGDNQIDMFLWPDAMLGVWVVRLAAVSVVDGRYHAWIERDDPTFQSRFIAASATPTSTTGSLSNGRLAIVVSAYDSRLPSKPPAPFSSAGPARDLRLKPDISAPGVALRVARSSPRTPGPRARDGVTVRSGTSFAAPYVAGVVALMFEAASPYEPSATEVRAILMETARRGPPDSDADRLRYGAGRVDAVAAVQAARKLGDSKAKTHRRGLNADGHARDSVLR